MPAKAAIIDKDASKRFFLVRTHLKFIQEEMALACGVSQSTITKIENGTTDIPLSVIRTLYIKFNISPMYIVANEPPMIYKKVNVNSIVRNIPTMQADIEIIKGQVKLLTTFINKTKTI